VKWPDLTHDQTKISGKTGPIRGDIVLRYSLKKVYLYLKKIYKRYNEVQIGFLAAQTSFYVILAFFPFTAFMLTLIKETKLDDTLFMQALSGLLPASTYVLTLQILESAQANKNLFISISGIAASLWPFSRAVKSLMASINEVYNHEKRPPLKQLGISMLLTAAFVILIIVSIILLLFGRRLGEIIFGYLGSPDVFLRVWDYLRYELSVLILLVFFIIMYKTIPTGKQRISDVFPGASFATLFWLVLSSVFSMLMNRYFKFATIYGGIAGIIFLIVWLYWAMHIILIGAVINSISSGSVYATMRKIKK
jgi:membrane protein